MTSFCRNNAGACGGAARRDTLPTIRWNRQIGRVDDLRGDAGMSSFVVVSGDTVNFETAFGAATLGPPSPTTTISGTGAKLTSGATACVEGDEASVTLPGVQYMTTAFSTPGVGSLTITKLGSDQLAQKLTVGGKKAILVGSKFDATFTVTTPAQNATPAPDPTPSYSGKGSFSTSDTKLDTA
jgi:hypothetical protein